VSDALLVGLGNPGPRYETTRHNVGFMAVDRIADRFRIGLTQQKFHGRYGSGIVCDASLVLLEPETFMNVSGKSVAAAAQFYRLEPDAIIVAHDDIDLDLGKVKVKRGGGHGGHNGLRDIAAKLGTKDFVRIRIGVGRPEHGDVTNWVLSRFRDDEMSMVEDALDTAADAVEVLVKDGLEAAQNEINGR
jgi:PTH1 family peptidyl-tRNA hydrolase